MRRHAALWALLAVLLVTSGVRLRVADVPIERDEGEYAYAAQLILQGIPPYVLAYNMKFPGPYYAYSAILTVFGRTPRGIHAGLLIVNVATALVLFFLARRLLQSPTAAAIAAATFALLSVDRWVMGVFAHATHFVLLPALAGLLLLVRAFDAPRRSTWIGAGVLLGTAVLMKQHAAVYVVLAFGLLIWRDRREARGLRDTTRAGLMVGAGVALPFALLGIVLAAQGALGQFWYWTIDYARAYVSEVPLAAAWPVLRIAWVFITQATTAIWILAAAGLAALWLLRWPAEARVWVTGLAVFSFVAVCPGFYFRPHYFILLLPAAGLLVGVAVVSAERLLTLAMPRPWARGAALALALAAAGQYVVREHTYLFAMSTHDLSRSVYETNPFLEAPEIGRYLKEHTAADDRIAVLGSEPEIFFYADRTSATGYIYTYPLLESQPYAAAMAEQWTREIEAARPRYLVYAAIGSSWMDHPVTDQHLLQWASGYARSCYDVVGVADIETAHTTMVWEPEAARYQPHSPNVLYTLRRRTPGPCSATP